MGNIRRWLYDRFKIELFTFPGPIPTHPYRMVAEIKDDGKSAAYSSQDSYQRHQQHFDKHDPGENSLFHPDRDEYSELMQSFIQHHQNRPEDAKGDDEVKNARHDLVLSQLCLKKLVEFGQHLLPGHYLVTKSGCSFYKVAFHCIRGIPVLYHQGDRGISLPRTQEVLALCYRQPSHRLVHFRHANARYPFDGVFPRRHFAMIALPE